MSSPATPPPQRIHPSRGKTWREWLLAVPALAVTGYVLVAMVKAGRSVPAVAYTFAAITLLALGYDVLMVLRGRSMVLMVGVIFGAAAVVSLVRDLAVGIPLAVVAVVAYAGIMLLIAFRKR